MSKELNLFLEPIKDKEALPIEKRALLQASKGEILELACEILQQVNDGILDDVDVKIFAKKGETFFKALNEGLSGKVELPQEKDYKKHGCTMNMQDTGVRYDYSVCGHPVIDEMNAFINYKKPLIDKLQKELKNIKSETEIVDEDTGETFKVKPPLKTGGRSVVIKFDK